MKQPGSLSAFPSEVLLRTDVNRNKMDERVSGPCFQNKTLVQGVYQSHGYSRWK